MSTPEKISPDDPRLTTYALGEMEPAERAEFELLLKQDAAARALVAEINGAAHHIGVALAGEAVPVMPVSAPVRTLAQAAILPGKDFRKLDGGPLTNGRKIVDEYAPSSKWLRFPQMYFAISGLAAACFAIGFVIWQAGYKPQPQVQYTAVDLTGFAPAEAEGAGGMKNGTMAAAKSGSDPVENAFVSAVNEPISTISPRVRTAAYAHVRRFIQGGHLPPPQVVRIEEMVNYFPYTYPSPKDEPFAAHLEVASAPWAPEHRLVRIGLKGRGEQTDGAMATIAKDVELQVEFNPQEVQSYRLLGYENRMPGRDDLNKNKIDAGEIEAGHTVTALYEVVSANAGKPKVGGLEHGTTAGPTLLDHAELLKLTVHYQEPVGEVSSKLEFALSDTGRKFDDASPDFQFAASVAAFGMILRDSPHKGAASFVQVRQWAQAGLGVDSEGLRSEFVGLVGQAERLSRN